MWPWIKRWRDWAMHDMWFMHRIGLQPQALHYSYEKAGLTLHDQPIPWNAEVVVVEALLRMQANSPLHKADFQIHLPGRPPVLAEALRRQEKDDRFHLFFRMSPPLQTVAAELRWRNYRLGQLPLPMLERDEFVHQLRLQQPTLFVRLGDHSVACQTFVSTQCQGLMASALLTSPTSLVPLVDLGLQVDFRAEKGSRVHSVPVQLASSQLADRQALVAVVPRHFRPRIGNWLATWRLGDIILATQRLRAISQLHFQHSLRVSDTRFIVMTAKGEVLITRQLPPLDDVRWIRPCFLVSSREPGVAALCRLQVRTQAPGAVQPLFALEHEVLITDGPLWFAPGTEDVTSLAQISAFELRFKDETLGILSLSPIPTADFTSEGGFKAPADFNWSFAADDELNDRLSRLLDKRTGKE